MRHGQSTGNVDKSVYLNTPDYTLRLTPEGHKQATMVGKQLAKIIGPHPVQFYVSPFWRTRQTFLNIAHEFPEHCVNYYEDPRLREQEWTTNFREHGDEWKCEKHRDSYGTFYYRFPGAESCADVYDRMSDFAGTLNRDFQKEKFPRNVIIVAHGMSIRCFIMRFFHASVEEFEMWANPKNCEYLLLERGDDEKFKLMTPMRLHKVDHNYQFDWTKWTKKYSKFGTARVPYVGNT